jgi:hypothetical protein
MIDRQVASLKMLAMTNIVLTLLCVCALALWEYRLHLVKVFVRDTIATAVQQVTEVVDADDVVVRVVQQPASKPTTNQASDSGD